jgi:hypothetical protein
MRTLPASHGAVLVGVLPLATAVFSACAAGEKPSAGFWDHGYARLGAGGRLCAAPERRHPAPGRPG